MSEIQSTTHAHETAGPLPAAIFTIFGATGDLSSRYIMPTLLHMESEHLFPEGFVIIAAGRRAISSTEFFALMDEAGFMPEVSEEALERFRKRVEYISASFEDPASFDKLKQRIGDRSGDPNGLGHECFNRFYYFAVAPKFFAVGAKLLQEHELLEPCTEHGRTIRLMIEKPFGSDAESAAALDTSLRQYFSENQIYRTDHYLGKETVQNMEVLRFANEFLEPIWNSKYVSHVEISMLEAEGIGSRGATYDTVGATNDVVQNHLLQLLAFTAIERPAKNDAESLRDEKSKVLQALRGFTAETIFGNVVRGQYSEGSLTVPQTEVAKKENSYAEDLGAPSATETFVAIRAFIDNPRWQGVPFYIRTGKRMANRIAEISVHFKPNTSELFEKEKVRPNILSVQLQPKEKITLRINNKIPGAMELHNGELVFNYEDQFHSDTPPAYERLFLDFFQGDQRLFIRNDEIQAAWKFVDSIRKNWSQENSPLHLYSGGTNGPAESEALVEHDGQAWFTK